MIQLRDDDSWRLVGCWAYSLNETERNKSATEPEFYAVVRASTALRPHVEGTHPAVWTDHHSLKWLLSLAEFPSRLRR